MKTYFYAILLWSILSNAQRQHAHTILLGLPTQEATPSSTSSTNDLCTTALTHCDEKNELSTVHDILIMFQCKEPILHAKICEPHFGKDYIHAVDELAACGRFAQEWGVCLEDLNEIAFYGTHGNNVPEALKCLQAEGKQYDQDLNAQLCMRYNSNEHDTTSAMMEAPLAKASVVGNGLGSVLHHCTPKDPTTAEHCLKSKRSFFNPLTFLKCVCDECDAESEYNRFGDCVIIPHCTDYEHCADCGCSGYLCCIQCEGNWVPNEDIGPEECVCPEPFEETDGQCA